MDDLSRFVLILLRTRMCEFLAGKKHSSLWSLVSTFVYVFIACREFLHVHAQ